MEVVQSAGFAVQSLQDTRFSIGFVGLFGFLDVYYRRSGFAGFMEPKGLQGLGDRGSLWETLSDKGFGVFSMDSMMTLKAERCCQAF